MISRILIEIPVAADFGMEVLEDIDKVITKSGIEIAVHNITVIQGGYLITPGHACMHYHDYNKHGSFGLSYIRMPRAYHIYTHAAGPLI